MFGQNKVEKVVHGPGETLRVVKGSPFYTVQGEGPFAGDPAVFIRLHGCNLRCWFCDTKFDDPDDPEMAVTTLVAAALALLPKEGKRLVVLTGGEPARQPIDKITKDLLAAGFLVQIETAGTVWRDCFSWDGVTVVVSPKTASIDQKVWEVAHAFKYVVRHGDVDLLTGTPRMDTQRKDKKGRLLATPRPGALVYLSPCDEYSPEKNALNTKAAVAASMAHGHRVIPQLHKQFDLP